jgi:hypothetical protein
MGSFAEYKRANIPSDGICPECGKHRGMNPMQWTLIPDHMYCKYCFMANVSDKDEQQRLRSAFIALVEAADGDYEPEVGTPTEVLIREMHELLTLMVSDHPIHILTTQTPLVSVAMCERHVATRMGITQAPNIIGRYLTGPELKDKYGDRLEKIPAMSLCKDLQAVITTPAIMALHSELLNSEHVPKWLSKAMNVWTNDRIEYPMYSCAYVKALAEALR